MFPFLPGSKAADFHPPQIKPLPNSGGLGIVVAESSRQTSTLGALLSVVLSALLRGEGLPTPTVSFQILGEITAPVRAFGGVGPCV